MPKTWTKALKGSISEVFATMFFMVLEEGPEILQAIQNEDAKDWLEGRLEVSQGQDKVSLWIWTPPQATLELAANLLSTDPDELGPDDLLDAHREMLNMVSGSVLTAVDRDGAWRMGLPKSRRLEEGTLQKAWSQADHLLGMVWEEVPVVSGVSVIKS